MLLAYIPSPEHGVIDVGPLQLHMYGLMLAIGILVAGWIAQKRWRAWGYPENTITEIAIPVVIGGVLGARIYHLFTGYSWDSGGIVGALKIWEGGLSIWGAVGGGFIAALVMARVKHVDTLALMDALAPGVVIAQAIGRWGNWFNQELYGRPTKLPWGLEIDNPPARYAQYKTFHPTFLYESLWCLAVFAVLVWAERRFRVKRGQTFAGYIALYTFGRIFFEAMRSDPASRILGVRFNLLLSALLCVFGAILWVVYGRTQPVARASEHGDEKEPVPLGDAPDPPA
ncbi:MAG TPA: prolipoprotein diacylglyceryl transferase [Acidimicrobiia bacterium]|nr:prolipoprotein diacylglyceryl transferase [Acidimicrobiia bacterium]